MIITDDIVTINIKIKDNLYDNLKFDEVEKLLQVYKEKTKNIQSKEKIRIPETSMYFTDDNEKNTFNAYIYKTSMGNDKWILFLMDEIEGYALYQNPTTNKLELAWYHANLQEPLDDDEERKHITCYIPKT